MATNYGSGPKLSLNYIYICLGINGIKKDEHLNSNPSSSTFFGNNRKSPISDGLLCL